MPDTGFPKFKKQAYFVLEPPLNIYFYLSFIIFYYENIYFRHRHLKYS